MNHSLIPVSQSYDPSKPNFELHLSLWWKSIEFMGFDQIYFLRQCNKPFQLLIDRLVNKGMLKDRVELVLELEIPMFREIIKNMLISSGAMITGSRILSILLPEIKFNDIDIFIPEAHIDSFIDAFANAGCKAEKLHDTTDINEIYSLSRRIGIVRNMITSKGHKIQLVSILDDDSVENAVLNFDFDVVKNSYNGNKLLVKHPAAIASKIATHNQNEDLAFRESLTWRCAKYRSKGFCVKTIRKPYFREWKPRNVYPEFMRSCIEKMQDKINDLLKERRELRDIKENKRADLLEFEPSLGELFIAAENMATDSM